MELPDAPLVLRRPPRRRVHPSVTTTSDEEASSTYLNSSSEGYSETRASDYKVEESSNETAILQEEYFDLNLRELFYEVYQEQAETIPDQHSDIDYQVPRFMGYVPTESIIDFLQKFELFAAMKSYTPQQQAAVLAAALQGPAKTAYLAEIALGNAGNIDTTSAQTTVTTTKDWLKTNYYTEEIQQGIRDQISSLAQGLNEDPVTFATRIQHHIELAKYPPAV